MALLVIILPPYSLPLMLRSFFLFACLLGLFTTAEAVAAPARKILPGNHRPNYRLYGHHGLFEKGLFGGFHRKATARPSNTHFAKKHRGTL